MSQSPLPLEQFRTRSGRLPDSFAMHLSPGETIEHNGRRGVVVRVACEAEHGRTVTTVTVQDKDFVLRDFVVDGEARIRRIAA